MEKLYDKYFQKSSVFLYPLLEIPFNKVKPSKTYMFYDRKSSDRKCLICKFKIEENNEEIESELFNNPYYENYEMVGDESIFIFNFENTDFESDFEKVIEGKYSQIQNSSKAKILNFYKTSATVENIKSYLVPKKYFDVYAELLREDVKLLQEVGELCDLPDFEKETFNK